MISPVTKRARRDASVLTVGTLLSGVAAYGFIMLGTRAIGGPAFAPVSILWSLWAVTSAGITFPIQHWIIRTVEASEGEAPAWAALPRLVLLVLGTAALALLVAVLAGGALYPDAGLEFAVMTGLLPVGGALAGVSRGMLSARKRFGATASVIFGENAIRVLLVIVLGEELGAAGLGWALIAGFVITGAFPTAFRPQGPGHATRSSSGSLGLLTGLAGANVAAQTILTSAPVLLSLLGGAPARVTELFALLAVLRAPYMVALGVTARMTGPLTRAVIRPTPSAHVWTRRLGLATAVTAGVAGLAGPQVLPATTRTAFGLTPQFSDLTVALVTVGSVLALGNLGQMLMLVARADTPALWRSWALAFIVGLLLLVAPLEATERVAGAFVTAELVAFLAMGSVIWTRHPVSDLTPTPP